MRTVKPLWSKVCGRQPQWFYVYLASYSEPCNRFTGILWTVYRLVMDALSDCSQLFFELEILQSTGNR